MNTRPRRMANKNSAARLVGISWAGVALAASLAHPISFVLLLAAATLMLAAVCELIGFGGEGAWSRTLARRGAVHFVLQVFFSFIMVGVIAGPLAWLLRGGALPAALSLSAVCVVALIALARVWPAFALPYLWDDAFPHDSTGSWIWRATRRSLRFAAHLSRRNDRFFSHALPASLGQLVIFASALGLAAGVQGWPLGLRLAVFAVYGLLVLPAAQVLLVNRCLGLMVADRQDRAAPQASHARGGSEPDAQQTPESLVGLIEGGHSAAAIALVEADPAAHLGHMERAVLAACTQGDLSVLRALLGAGASLHDSQAGSPLLAAMRKPREDERQAELVMTLLANGANVRSIDEDGAGPLHLAAQYFGAAVAALLLDGGAMLDSVDDQGHTPLARACVHGNWAFARELINSGASTQPAGAPPLLLAAAQGDDVRGVELLLKHRADVDAAGVLGRTPLLAAVLAGRSRISTVLLEAGADVDLADERGTTPLMEAARTGSLEMLELLAGYGPDLDARDSLGRTALAIACVARQGSRGLIERLLGLGADPTVSDNAGKCPVDHASSSGRWHLLQVLDLKGARTPAGDESIAGVPGNADHLLDALRFGHWKLVDQYHRRAAVWPRSALAGIFRELTDVGQARARDWLFNQGLTVDTELPDGAPLVEALLDVLPESAPALAHAVRRAALVNGRAIVARILAKLPPPGGDGRDGLLRLVSLLIEGGADIFGVDGRGDSALHHAARLGLDEMLHGLLEAGVDPNQRNDRGLGAIQTAMQTDRAVATRTLQLLLFHGADPLVRSATGETALGTALADDRQDLAWWLDWTGWQPPGRRLRGEDLCAAAAAGDADAVARLLGLGLPVDGCDRRGATALLHGIGMGHRDVVTLLLEHRADPLRVTESGATCLSAAVHSGDGELLALLVERGVDVDHCAEGGATALMVAAALGAHSMVELLLRAGARVNATDSRGMSALLGAAREAFASSDADRTCMLLGQLLDAGADVDATNSNGQDALCLLLGGDAAPGSMCHAGVLTHILSFMLARGASIGAADQRGVSALHACAMHGLLGCARMLVDAGADLGVVDTMGRTPADVAALLGYVDVAAELRGGHTGVPGARRMLRQRATPE